MKVIWIVFGIFVLVYGSFLLLKNTIFNTKYVITQVNYDSGNLTQYDDPYMYKAISAQIKQENYTIVRFQKNTILASLQMSYPFIKDMVIEFTTANTVKVSLIFQEPELIIRNQTLKFGVFRGHIFPIYSGDSLGKNIKTIIDLPEYLSGYGAMTGFFFRQPASDLIQQVELIYQWFPSLHHIEYLPGGERTIVYIDGKKIYINNLADVAQQIRKYELLKRYYTDFASVKEMDLWSIEVDKLIVKK